MLDKKNQNNLSIFKIKILNRVKLIEFNLFLFESIKLSILFLFIFEYGEGVIFSSCFRI